MKRWRKSTTERRGCSSSRWITSGRCQSKTTKDSSRSRKKLRLRSFATTTRAAPFKRKKMESFCLEKSGELSRERHQSKTQ